MLFKFGEFRMAVTIEHTIQYSKYLIRKLANCQIKAEGEREREERETQEIKLICK